MIKYQQWLCVALLFCGVSVANAQQKLVFTPQWTAQAQFVGFYVASNMGYYKEAGLDVVIKHPSASKPSINYLTEGESQFITLNLVSAMSFIDNGIPLVNVLQMSQQNNLMIVSHTPLNGKESLRGKKVGHWKSGFSELPMAMDKKFGLGIQWVPFISNVNLYISGAIDATVAMSYNEFFQLKMAGQRIKDEQLLYMRDIGYNVPEDGVYVTAEFYRKHKDLVTKFAEATRKGWEWAVEHPDEALDIVMVTMRQSGAIGNMIAQEWMLKQILNQLADKDSGQRSYKLEPKSVELANRILMESGFIKKEITYHQITQL
jgi:NitT/TauT family transport system substrate-binding protein